MKSFPRWVSVDNKSLAHNRLHQKRVRGLRGKHLQTQLDNGGLLLWVHTRDTEHERSAIDIMKRHSGQDVHLHTLPVDPNAPRVEFQPPLSPH